MTAVALHRQGHLSGWHDDGIADAACRKTCAGMCVACHPRTARNRTQTGAKKMSERHMKCLIHVGATNRLTAHQTCDDASHWHTGSCHELGSQVRAWCSFPARPSATPLHGVQCTLSLLRCEFPRCCLLPGYPMLAIRKAGSASIKLAVLQLRPAQIYDTSNPARSTCIMYALPGPCGRELDLRGGRTSAAVRSARQQTALFGEQHRRCLVTARTYTQYHRTAHRRIDVADGQATAAIAARSNQPCAANPHKVRVTSASSARPRLGVLLR